MSTVRSEHVWWQRAAVYQVYPRSFRDLDGDGTGDLRGVIHELPYIAGLAVDALWLSPFYSSPQNDSGYDVVDPRSVDPVYGTLADAQELIDQAHYRGLRVLVDIVPNHSSSDRPWFKEALQAAPGSPERARYHFMDGRGPHGNEPPNNWMSMFGGSAWTRIHEVDGSPGQWYLHLFDPTQPDLNWSNPQVHLDGLETLRFWLDMGADGFRVDVALGLAKDMTYPDVDDPEGLVLALRMDLDDGSDEAKARRLRVANCPILDRDEVQDISREWRALLDSYPGDRMAVAEAWVPPARAARYVAPDTLNQIFNFDFMAVGWDAVKIKDIVQRTISDLADVGAPPTWALSNHDTARVVTRLGGGPLGRQRARAMALIAHSLPGSVYVYQGEELGLEDADMPDEARRDPVWFRTKGEQKGRDGGRVPLPWRGDAPPYGFHDTIVNAIVPALWLPPPPGWAEFTVESQSRDASSTLAQYRSMLRLRHAHPGFADLDNVTWPDVPTGVFAIRRSCGFACIVNCTDEEMISPIGGVVLTASDGSVHADNGIVRLPPDTGAWIQT
ncbi:MAG: alpha-amylase family glycosyl hydrolase [bacterium]|nr:alpha-amylase family glycosyl hydrolase [bacterium]